MRNNVLRQNLIGLFFCWGVRFAVAERNRIEDSGPETGTGIDVQGSTEGVTLAGNEVRETRGPAQRTGIRISAQTRDLRLEGNRIDGVAVPIADLRKA